MKQKKLTRPKYVHEVVKGINSLEDFGYALRDWQHELKLLTSRKEFAGRISTAPELLANRFEEGTVADAYLAAYCAFIADKLAIDRPGWTYDKTRISKKPWFAHTDHNALLITTPASFREKNIFTVPENVLRLRSGRPRLSKQHKNKINAERQRRYRDRIRKELEGYRRQKQMLKRS